MFASGLNGLKLFPWALAALFCALAVYVAGKWRDTTLALTEYRASVEQAARDQERKSAEIEAQHRKTLEIVRNDHEKRLPAVRAAAVRAYRMRQPLGDGLRALSFAAPRFGVDDGSAGERVVIDAASPAPVGAHGVRPDVAHGVRPDVAHGVRPDVAHGVRPVSAHTNGCVTPGRTPCAPTTPANTEDAFIAACAEDALKVSAWQDWAKRNHVPQE